MSDEDREGPYVREISINEIFPDKDIPHGQPLRLRTFDLAFYPEERGPYNFDVEGIPGTSSGINSDGELIDPESRWEEYSDKFKLTILNRQILNFRILDDGSIP